MVTRRNHMWQAFLQRLMSSYFWWWKFIIYLTESWRVFSILLKFCGCQVRWYAVVIGWGIPADAVLGEVLWWKQLKKVKLVVVSCVCIDEVNLVVSINHINSIKSTLLKIRLAYTDRRAELYKNVCKISYYIISIRSNWILKQLSFGVV